jgi:hypothetical protein
VLRLDRSIDIGPEEQQLVLKKGSVINGVAAPLWTTASPGLSAAGMLFRWTCYNRYCRLRLMIFAVILMGCSSCRLSRRKQGLFGAGQAKSWRTPRYYHRISARRILRSASSPIARFVHRLSSLSCILAYTTPPSATLFSPAPCSHPLPRLPYLPSIPAVPMEIHVYPRQANMSSRFSLMAHTDE